MKKDLYLHNASIGAKTLAQGCVRSRIEQLQKRPRTVTSLLRCVVYGWGSSPSK